FVRSRHPRYGADAGPRLVGRAADDHGGRAPRPAARRSAARSHRPPRVARSRGGPRRCVPDRQRESGPRGMTIVAAAPLVLGAAACISFAFRKRLVIVAPFALAAIAAAAGLVLDVPPDSNGTLLDLELRVSPLGQLAALVILGTLLLLVLDVWLDEPAYNFFPTALAVVATALGVLVVIPFHTHAALLAGEVPAAALALYFGVLVPTTFVAFAEILTLSGLLPAIVQVVKVQDLLHGIGLVSAVGGAFLASGAPDLRRLVVYSVISNLGAALVGMATLSGPGIIGAVASVLVTGASASGQLLAAGALERLSAPERPIASRAPLAALAFVVGGFAMIGAPPLLGFPGRFFMELIAYQFAPVTGTALVLATLLLIVGQLRAVISLFGSGAGHWVIERRPIAGIIGGVIFVALLIGGIQPEGFLAPIA